MSTNNDSTPSAKIRPAACSAVFLTGVLLLLFSFPVYSQEGYKGSKLYMLIRADKRPLILYLDEFSTLRALDCADADCTVAIDGYRLDRAFGDTRPEMALRQDGRPLIVYRGASGGSLNVFDCDHSSCSSGMPRPLKTDASPTGVAIAIR